MADRIGKRAPLGKEILEWHWVYTKEEADARGLEYVHWRHAETGQWALTDDDYVAQVLNLQIYRNKKGVTRRYLRFVFCKIFVMGKPLMYQIYKEKGDYNKIKPEGDLERGRLRQKHRNFAFMYAQMMVHNGWVNWTKLGKAFNPTAKNPKLNAQSLAKVPKMQQMIQDEVKKALLSNDVTADSVIKMVLEASNVAKGKKDAGNMLKAADMLMDVLQIKVKRGTMVPEHEQEAVEALFEVLNDRKQAISAPADALPEPRGAREGDHTADVPGAISPVPPRAFPDMPG